MVVNINCSKDDGQWVSKWSFEIVEKFRWLLWAREYSKNN